MARRTSSSDPDAVSRALRSWTNQLIDTGGRNRLLYFKHLKRGTLDLGPDSGADPAVAAALRRGRSVKLSDCFPDDNGADASQRARWILRKAREHEEEQGIRTLYLGWRFATWQQSGPGPATPNAPLLLAAAELTPQGRMGDDFTLSIADDWEVNPSMAQLLKREFGAELNEAALEDLLQAAPLDDAAILNLLRRAYDAIPGFDIHDGLVLGTFSYAKLPMVRDLEAAEAAVAQHPLVAAIAGDPQAQEQLRDTQRNGAHGQSVPGGDDLLPRDEFLVLDADGTQSEVINAAVAGANLVVVGPPGTGKSQTIANLLATLTARGRSTLFVAEKRAAIDAVVKRLNSVGLGDLVLDLHEGMRSRRQTAEQLAAALQAAHTAHAPNVETLQRTLTQSRKRLSDAERELHQPHEPWGLSIYQLQSRILGMGDSKDIGLRTSGRALNALHGEALEAAKDELAEYINLNGAVLDASPDAPWGAAHRASRLSTSERAAEAVRLLDDLSGRLLPEVEHELAEMTQHLGINPPATVPMTQALLEALARFKQLHGRFAPAVFQAGDVESLLSALDPAERGPLAGLSETDLTPWGVTVEELDLRIQALAPAPETSLRLRGDRLKRLRGDMLAQAMADLEEYVDRGGAELDVSDAAPWSAAHQASSLRSEAAIDEAGRLLDRLSGELLPALEREIAPIAQQLGIEQPLTTAAAQALLESLARFAPLRERLNPAVFEAGDLEGVVAQLEVADQGPLAGVSDNERTAWGITIGELDSRIQALGDTPASEVRLESAALMALTGDRLQRAMTDIAEYVNRGGAALDASVSPWSRAHQASAVHSDEQAAAVADLLEALSSKLLPTAEHELHHIARQLDIDTPDTIDEAQSTIAAIRQMQSQQEWFASAVLEADVETLIAELEPTQRGILRRLKAQLLNAPYRRAVRRAAELLQAEPTSPADAYTRLVAFSKASAAWREIAPGSPPAAVWEVEVDDCAAAVEQFADALATFRKLVAFDDADLGWAAQREQLNELEQERAVLTQLPHLSSLCSRLAQVSIADFAREAERRNWSGRQTARALDEAWTRSVLDELTESEPTWRAPYRAARANADEWLIHRDMPTAWVHRWLREFVDARDLWQRATTASPTPAAWTIAPDQAANALERFSETLAALCALAALDDAHLDWSAQRMRLEALQNHRAVLSQLPRLASLRERLQDAAILDFAREAQQHGWTGDRAAQSLNDAWTRSVLDEVQESEPTSHAPYRTARARVDELLTHTAMPTAWVVQWLREFVEAQRIWQRAVASTPTAAVWTASPANCATALAQFAEAADAFSNLAALDDAALDWAARRAQIDSLQRDRTVAHRLPRLHDLRASLKRRGMTRLVAAVHRRGLDGRGAVEAFEDAWARSVLNAVSADAPIFASFNADGHNKAVAEFCDADREHIAQSPQRVVRAWAEAAVAARDEHPEQSQLIMREANRKRRHLPTRDLFQQAPDVLTALKPCWVMSPLVVAQLLPLDGDPPFDVVVFDEASQIPPADAVSSLLRGRQAIVAGDPKQLPPTSFFTSSSEDEDEENDQDAPLTQDVESILDAMSTLLPMPWGSRTLGWHYRSKDERLIAFSNHHVYDRRLTTFPGALPDDCLEHVEVPFEPDASWVSGSYSPEVQRVVELILRHAAERPDETLGVIALGAAHANRIAETLRLARRDRPELDGFFSEANAEPFFVKNLERVQGDERDAIILTVGYGRTEHGRMRYNFGPINQEGGFRRLNVAVTRAKRRMTVVSCFSHEDMDPDRLNNEGVQRLRDYIEYAAGGGRKLGAGPVNIPPLNPFEIDIRDRLEARGLKLQPQYGVSGYRIDFAAMHPDEPGRPILAIEADGAQYHSAQAARDRDRLRQENLERLGWRFHRIWSTEWFRNPELGADRALAAYEQALAADRTTASSAPSPPKELPEEPPEEPPPPPSRGPRPPVQPGQKIDDYSPGQLTSIIEWIESDGRLRTEDELLAEAMQELGFKRRGTKIVAALTEAIRRAR